MHIGVIQPQDLKEFSTTKVKNGSSYLGKWRCVQASKF